MRGKALTKQERLAVLAAHRRGESANAIARQIGRSSRSVQRVLSAVRTADEFTGKLRAELSTKAPRSQQPSTSWTLEAVRAARDAQLRGDFRVPHLLAEAMRTDDAIYVARSNRLAPHSALEAAIVADAGVEGERIAKKARRAITTPRDVLQGINGTLADHGIAIGHIEQATDDDGALVTMRLREWPIEHVKYNSSTEILETRTDAGEIIPIVHGDGEWIVFANFEHKPWAQAGALLPAAMVWAMHAAGLSDWAGAMRSHGLAKIVGQLPEGIALLRESGELTAEAEAFLDMVTDIASGEAAAGIVPPGGKADFVNNSSGAWQIFTEMVMGREKAAARIYLGTDAILGSVGGAPGVDIAQLFGVATTKIQGDLQALEQGITTGMLAPWTAINYGTSRHAPRLEYAMPDPDAEAKSAEQAARLDRLFAAVEGLNSKGFVIDQTVIADLARRLKLDWTPQLADQVSKRVPLELAPTDIARVVRVREARASQGLPPLGDYRDDLFVSELEARAEAEAEAGANAAPA